MGFCDTVVAGFSEAGWLECLGEYVDLGFDLGRRTEGEFVDEEFGGGWGIERNCELEEESEWGIKNVSVDEWEWRGWVWLNDSVRERGVNFYLYKIEPLRVNF